MKKSGFKLKGWGGYQNSPVKQKKELTEDIEEEYQKNWPDRKEGEEMTLEQELTGYEGDLRLAIKHGENQGVIDGLKNDIARTKERMKYIDE